MTDKQETDKNLAIPVLVSLYKSDIDKLDTWRDQLSIAGTHGGNISRSRMVRILIQERSQERKQTKKNKQPPPTAIAPFSSPQH
jgi:hypothetical protein